VDGRIVGLGVVLDSTVWVGEDTIRVSPVGEGEDDRVVVGTITASGGRVDTGAHACSSNSTMIIDNNPCRTLAVYHKMSIRLAIIKPP